MLIGTSLNLLLLPSPGNWLSDSQIFKKILFEDGQSVTDDPFILLNANQPSPDSFHFKTVSNHMSNISTDQDYCVLRLRPQIQFPKCRVL